MPPGYALARLGDIDSTNLEATRKAVAGEVGPVWIWAERQLAGRGRMGRGWVSETGNLYSSLLLPVAAGERLHELSFVAALAVFATAAACLPSRDACKLKLKWPNDLLLDGKKTAGILLEQAGESSIVIGFGLNLGNVPTGGIRRPATGLALHGATASAGEALEQLASATDHFLRLWRTQGFAAIRSAWLEKALGLGEMINVSQIDGTLTGRFTALDKNGALLLEMPSGEIVRILAADVELATS